MGLKKLLKILVPLDDSENSKRALEEAIVLARLSGAIITEIYVISSEKGTESFISALKPLSSLEEKNFTSKELSKANGIIGEAHKKCKENIVDFKGIVAKGSPREKIVQFAQDNKFDHVVIGMTGRVHVGEVLFGSVSYYVVHNVNMPVVIVK